MTVVCQIDDFRRYGVSRYSEPVSVYGIFSEFSLVIYLKKKYIYVIKINKCNGDYFTLIKYISFKF